MLSVRSHSVAPRWCAHVIVAVLSIASASSANASVGDDLHGARTAAMGGAHTGIATSNDAITKNPAGMAIWRRYSIDLQYSHGSTDDLSRIGFSAVDSQSGPVAGGFAYSNTRGDGEDVDPNLHHFYLAAAYPITSMFAFGITARHVRGSFNDDAGERHNVKLYAGDLGVATVLGSGLTLGFAYHRVVQSERGILTPPSIEFGGSFGTPRLVVGADATLDLRDSRDRRWSYHTGAEFLLMDAFPLRAGYQYALPLPGNPSRVVAHTVTAGVGWVTAKGAVDASFQKVVAGGTDLQIIAALRFFL